MPHKLNIRFWIFWAKLTNHEYWPWYILFAFALPQYLYYSLRTGSWVWFTNLNTSIPLGGFFGESKSDILDKIDPAFKPAGLFISEPYSAHTLLLRLEKAGIFFPFILKPDEGERGNGVAKIADPQELEAYLLQADYPLIAQEYVDYSLEFGVFYSRIPGTNRGAILSLTGKKFLSVLGDGQQTIEQLLSATPRGLMQLNRLQTEINVKEVPEVGDLRLLEPIGNHVRGTLFFDARNLINDDMNALFTSIANEIDGFHFGRFDIRVKTKEGLYSGHNMRILELNGVSSDPTHIFDPALSYWAVARYLMWHLHRIYTLSKEQIMQGVKPATLAEVRAEVRRHNEVLRERALLKPTAAATYTKSALAPIQGV